jgi:hypothetical protein
MADEQQPGKEKHRMEVYWTTVTYKTVAIYIVGVFVLILAVLYFMYPERFANIERKITQSMSGSSEPPPPPTSTQARFVNLDGKVEVKRVDSVQWTVADYRTSLNKGDLIRTGGDAVARITFPDGSTYTVKPDTLITVEENTVAQDRSTRVGVHISSGAVDLATGAFEAPNSKAEVSFENARASVKENSRVAVRSDPAKQQHEITVLQGQGELQRTTDRGVERVELSRFERVSFPTGGEVRKAHVLAPPQLTSPRHLQVVSVESAKRGTVQFQWEAVPDAVGYILMVSTSSMFSHVAAEKHTSGTSAEVTGLEPGDYFWAVKAVDVQKQVSESSEILKFMLAVQGKSQEMLLEVAAPQVHGNVVEIVGRTEPGAAILINGQPVGNIQPDGTFRHFTPPLPRGPQKIVISGQNRRGGATIKRLDIVIP